MKKFLFLVVLAGVIFGGAYYAAWVLFLKPRQELKAVQGATPPPAPPDPSLADFEKCLALQGSVPPAQVQQGWRDFVERNPHSSKLDEARQRLGAVNMALFLSAAEAPGKTVYEVKRGDVITRVASRFKSTPELIMKVNHLSQSMLRIGQRLVVPTLHFSLLIDRTRQKVIVLQWPEGAEKGIFFAEYPVLVLPVRAVKEHPAGPTPRPVKVSAKVSEVVAWKEGQRVIFTDKGFAPTEHWIVISPSGYSLYTQSPAVEGKPPLQKPPGGGYGLAPDAMQDLAAVLRKGDDVLLE